MTTMRTWTKLTLALTVLMAAGLVAGCAKDKEPIDPGLEATDFDGAGGAGGDEITVGEGLPGGLTGDDIFYGPSKLQPIYFDLDSSELRPDAIATLRDNADKIKRAPSLRIQVAGHCDERGTQEYNLALGERRALSVREHLMRLGVSGDRLITISYGEEFPAVDGTGEAAWSKNRRCEFNEAR